jgi:arylsulfatase A-like enzyme
VELLDLYPTLRDLVAPGQEVAGLEGQSLTPFLRAGQSRPEETAAFEFAFSQAGGGGGASRSHFRSVQDGEWKLVFHPARRARPASWELYDLRQNPGETLDVANLHPGQVRRLAREMSAWMKGRDWIDPPDGLVRERSEDTLRALRALGYVQ